MTDKDKLSPKEKREIQRSFRVLDVNKDGRISPGEVINGVRVLGLNPTQKEATDILKQIDTSGKGYIEYEEFEKLMIPRVKQKIKEEELFLEAFQKFDKDGSGSIDYEELKTVLMEAGDKMTEKDVDEFFREADLNGDGKIDYYEFVRWFSKV